MRFHVFFLVYGVGVAVGEKKKLKKQMCFFRFFVGKPNYLDGDDDEKSSDV